jgi:hypothetical protein
VLPVNVATDALALLREHGLDARVYRGNDWMVTKPDAPSVEHECWTVEFPPRVGVDFSGLLDGVAKIAGVSDDPENVRICVGSRVRGDTA